MTTMPVPSLKESNLKMDHTYPATRQEGEEVIPCEVILREEPEGGHSYLVEYDGRKYSATFDAEGFHFRY